MSNTNRILKNIVSMGVTEFSAKGLAVIYTIYLISTIGPESNGAFSFAKSIVQYFFNHRNAWFRPNSHSRRNQKP